MNAPLDDADQDHQIGAVDHAGPRGRLTDRLASRLVSRLGSLIAVCVAAVAMIASWYAVVVCLDLPAIILPLPHQCLAAILQNADTLFWAAMTTGAASVSGLLLAVGLALVLSFAFTLVPVLRTAFFPYVLALQTMPIVAVAPLLVVWSGYTFRSVVIVVVIVCLFPIVNALVEGLRRTDQDHDDLLTLYGAGRLTRLFRLQLPTAIEELVTALKTAAALSVIGAIVAEFFVGSGVETVGLGFLMTAWQMQNRTDSLIAALVISALLGLVLYLTIDFLARRLLGRWLVYNSPHE